MVAKRALDLNQDENKNVWLHRQHSKDFYTGQISGNLVELCQAGNSSQLLASRKKIHNIRSVTFQILTKYFSV